MKKSALLNSELSYVIAKMGHTDTLTVGDCGLPIPQETQRIDLALRKGTPGFLETLDTILEELQSLDDSDRNVDIEELLVPLRHVLDILDGDEKGGNYNE